MWQYVTMWHKANWTGAQSARGWAGWVMESEATLAPPDSAADAEALDFMGRNRWELVHVENILDMPPNVTNAAYGANRRLYYFKRPLED